VKPSRILAFLLPVLFVGQGWTQTDMAPGIAEATLLSAEQRGVQRAQIISQRAEQAAKLQAQESVCRQSFWVNDCLRDAQASHRAVVSRLDQQVHALDEVERRQRAAAVLERTQARQEQSERPTVSQPRGSGLPAEQTTALKQRKARESAQQRMIKQQKKQELLSQRAQRREQAAQAARANLLRRQSDKAESSQESLR